MTEGASRDISQARRGFRQARSRASTVLDNNENHMASSHGSLSIFPRITTIPLPRPNYGEAIAMQPTYMGQDPLNPPSVEGWYAGSEWMNSGSLMSRINFAADMVGNTSLPGVCDLISRLKAWGTLLPEAFVDACLELLRPLEVGQDTR
jgi:hypothetical protein